MIFRQRGLKHLALRIAPKLTAKHKDKKVRFARQAPGDCVMAQSTSFFKGRPAGIWCTPQTRDLVAKNKHSAGVHVYMGITYIGTAQLTFVTGTMGQGPISEYVDPTTGRPLPGVRGQE